jgi:hypothetical protein
MRDAPVSEIALALVVALAIFQPLSSGPFLYA